MDALQQAREKLQSAVTYIQELKTADFPHADAQRALPLLEKALLDLRDDADAALKRSTHPSIARSICKRTFNQIEESLEVVGLIVNSTNIRNAFEVHEPLLQIAKSLIGPDAQLILSFEWKYIPFTYPQNIPSLPNFVIIGLPASESTNALILPAAGHELGHSVWRSGNYSSTYDLPIQQAIKSEITQNRWADFTNFLPNVKPTELDTASGKAIWGRAFNWAMSHCEEIFCDICGLHIFGSSYLHAFEYLVAPNLGEHRSEGYPPLRTRAEILVEASHKLQIRSPDKYDLSFDMERSPFNPKQFSQYLLDVADSVTRQFSSGIIADVGKFCSSKSLAAPKHTDWGHIATALRNYVPAADAPGLPHILNAAWEVYLDPGYMKTVEASGKRKVALLNELTLKSIEVFEMSQTLLR